MNGRIDTGVQYALSYSLRADQDSVIFSLAGAEDDVVKHLRELFYYHLQGQNCSWGKEQPVPGKAAHDNSHVCYNIYVNNTKTAAMEEIFWYLGKVSNYFPNPDIFCELYPNISIHPKDLNPQANVVIERLGLTLARAAHLAKQREHEPLVFQYTDLAALHKEQERIPTDLWTKDELLQEQLYRENGRKIQEQEKYNKSWAAMFSKIPERLGELLGLNEESAQECKQQSKPGKP